MTKTGSCASPRELEELLEVCDRARAWYIAAVSGEIDVRNSDDLFRARILAAVHAKESDNISRRVRRKQQELAERGRPHGGHGVTATTQLQCHRAR
jgi:site-specific DNA recombinase